MALQLTAAYFGSLALRWVTSQSPDVKPDVIDWQRHVTDAKDLCNASSLSEELKQALNGILVETTFTPNAAGDVSERADDVSTPPEDVS